MRITRKVLVSAGAMVVAVLLLLLVVVPALIDWDSYKGELSARLEDALGRKVAIAGPLRIRLLPSPAITAHDVSLANLPGAQPDTMASVKALSLSVRLMPLLGGNVVITSLALDRPVIHLQRLPDGRANWRFTSPGTPDGAATGAGPSAAGPKRVVDIHALTVTDGVVTWQSGEGAPLTVDALNARVAMKTISGPFAAKVSGRIRGIPVNVDASLGALEVNNGAAPLLLKVDLPSADTKLTLGGMLSSLTAGRMVSGHLNVEVADPARLSAVLGGPAALPLPGAVTAAGTLAASGEDASLKELAITVGHTRATGNITAELSGTPRVDVSLTVPSLDVDEWLGQGASSAAAPASPAANASGSPSAPAAGPDEGFSLPAGLSVTAALAVDAASWRGKVIRQTRIDGTLDKGALALTHLTALLPGDTTLTGEGTLAPRQGRPAFDGHLETSSSDLRTLLAWLGMDISAVPGDRLRRFTAAAGVTGDPAQATLRDIDLTVDDVHATGQVSARLGAPRPSYALAAAVDTLNLDSYLPGGPNAGAGNAAARGGRENPVPAAAVPAKPAATGVPVDLDVSADVSVRHLTVRGIPADAVKLEGRLNGGNLGVRDAEAVVAGTQASLSGTVRGLGQGIPQLDGVVFEMDSPRPGRLLGVLSGTRSDFLDRLGAVTADGTLSGGLDTLTAKLRALSDGFEASAQGTIGDVRTAPRYQMALAASAPSTAQALHFLLPTYRPQGRIGPFTAAAKLDGDAKGAQVSGIDIRAGEAHVTGSAALALGGARPAVTATLAGNAITLDPFLSAERTGAAAVPERRGGSRPHPAIVPAAAKSTADNAPWSTEPLDLSLLQTMDMRADVRADAVTWKGWRMDNPQAHVVIDNGAIQLDKLTGKLLGGDMSLALRLAGGALPQLSGSLSIAGANLSQAKLGSGSIQLTQGTMDTDARFSATGRSSAEMASHLGGDGRFSVKDGVVSGFDLPAVNQQLQHIQNIGNLLVLAQTALSGGTTGFSSLTGTAQAQNGVVTTRDTKLNAQGGAATAEAAVDLPRWTINSRIAFRLADSTAPPLGLRFEGPLDNPRKIIDINELQRYLVERGLGKALKGKGGSLQDLLGGVTGAPQQQQQQPGQAQPQQQSPQQMLQNLLKGLGGK
ncbi:MAG: AsmA family protein [Magnetospirillum sp.]|nr:AsmA family protein [Magnetospirillum sp.]